jgi:uncharacterized membrane protein YdfJ with MMPL/SSD domain
MKLIKFLAYPVLVIAFWVALTAGTLSALGTLDTSLRSIAAAGQPAPAPSEATQPATPRTVAHGRSINHGQSPFAG